MKQEFVTLYGRAIIEKDTLYLRSPYLPFEKTAFAQVGYRLAFPLIFILQFFRSEGPKMYVGLLLWGIIMLFHLPALYDVLFKRSYASRIPLSRIRSYKIEDDHHGIQTEITLYLKNGRYRKILFRKLENQHVPFTEFISMHSSEFHFA